MALSLAGTATTLEGAAGPVVGLIETGFGVGVLAFAAEAPKLFKKGVEAIFGDAFEPVAPVQKAAPAFKM